MQTATELLLPAARDAAELQAFEDRRDCPEAPSWPLEIRQPPTEPPPPVGEEKVREMEKRAAPALGRAREVVWLLGARLLQVRDRWEAGELGALGASALAALLRALFDHAAIEVWNRQ